MRVSPCRPIPGWFIAGGTKHRLANGMEGSDQGIAPQVPRVFSLTVRDRLEPGLRQSGTMREKPEEACSL